MPQNSDWDALRRQASLDQAFSELADVFPQPLYRFFKLCADIGFTDEQAFALTCQWFASLLLVAVNVPAKQEGSEEDE